MWGYRFHPHRKIPQALEIAEKIVGPCPSFRGGKSKKDIRYGLTGFSLYPQEGSHALNASVKTRRDGVCGPSPFNFAKERGIE